MSTNQTDSIETETWEDDEFYAPEDALADHRHEIDALLDDASVMRWVHWAADSTERSPELARCIVEELADTHCPKAAAVITALPRRFAATVAKLHSSRLQFAGYQARKRLAGGARYDDLTPRLQGAVDELAYTETKAGRELRALLGMLPW
jgi:hypothetical protein